jgi:hypothetical protein
MHCHTPPGEYFARLKVRDAKDRRKLSAATARLTLRRETSANASGFKAPSVNETA